MKRLLLAVLLLAAAASSSLPAAPLERDLGEDLGYVRVHALPADLPSATAKARPLVLDLRFASGNADAATALAAWLKFSTTPQTPVFVLVNQATAPALLAVFAGPPHPGIFTLGSAPPPTAIDFPVEIPAADERAAYDALEHGMDIPALTRENLDKPRADEASIARERANDTTETPPEADDIDPPADAKPAPPPPLIDHALQRAIHLYRALHALKRV